MSSALLMQPNAPVSYDEVPYKSLAFSVTHPDRLAAVGTLLGMQPPPVDRCRVLELGCASGGNLLPLAQALPNSEFVGIDLSSRQIDEGLANLHEVKLPNVQFKVMNLLDVDASLGTFDYIICHGVYSWVPPPVQEKILAICGSMLSENGIAYVSYNTLPGWHMRGAIRDMMVYHANRFSAPDVKARQAKALIDFLAESVVRKDGPYGLMLKEQLEMIQKKDMTYLLHEFLEECNEPVYFHQFIERAEQHGLRYLGEAEMSSMAGHNFPADVRQTLQRVAPDQVRMEQYMDFLRNRMFRHTLLCRRHQPVRYRIDWRRLTGLYVSSPLQTTSSEPDVSSDRREEFKAPRNGTLTSREPIMKAGLLELCEQWPVPVPFNDLLQSARTRLGRTAGPEDPGYAADAERLANGLMQFYTSSAFVELSTIPPPFATKLSSRPLASAMARFQARSSRMVTNLRHQMVSLGEPNRHALMLLDGTRDYEQVVDDLVRLVEKGALTVQAPGGGQLFDLRRVRERLHAVLGSILLELGQLGLLVG